MEEAMEEAAATEEGPRAEEGPAAEQAEEGRATMGEARLLPVLSLAGYRPDEATVRAALFGR